ncbi:MAG: choice-of-anchor J domain-containing protein [Muribaculaceae bacterium]|nr:choice-of-anchor J domain-containing protein [Muribaculaceae bacterium]
MKRFYFYLSMLFLLVGFTGCNDEFDVPPLVVPTAQHTVNMSIADFKAKYWQDAVNYIDTVKEEIVIHGYVSSSDESGNIYKSLYIQDETGGLAISINQSGLNSSYRYGQDVVIPLKNMFVGKYNGLQQLGYPQYYDKGGVWEATFLPYEMWEATAEINGLPDPSKVDTVTVSIADFQGKTDGETLRKYQGQLVRINGVKFQDANGEVTFAEADATTNRNIIDTNGNSLVVRNSNYVSFRADMLPMGEGDIVGLLSYYATSNTRAGTWQLYLRDVTDCIGFTTDTKGLLKNPYSVEDGVTYQNSGRSGWVEGYIVGAVAPEVTSISGNGDIEWQAPTTLDNTLVIAPEPECKDISKCLVVALPQGTKFRQQANLKDNEGLYKSLIYIKGTFAPFMGANGITGNSGSTDEFVLTIVVGGVTELEEGFEGGLPSDWYNVQVKGDKKWYTTSFDNNTYAAMTGYKGTPPFDAWLITPALNIKDAANKILSFRTQVNGYGSTTSHFEVYVLDNPDPEKATIKAKLNPTIAVAPASGYSSWAQSGDLDLSAYNGTYFVGFRFEATSDANYATWCLDDVKFGKGSGGGGGGDDPGPAPVSSTRGDFETFNNGAATSYYGTHTSKQGWTANNCNILSGGDADSNPVFTFIGHSDANPTAWAFAPCLNGKTSTVGTLTSPTLKNGITKLEFKYGLPYSDTACSFRVDIKQGNNVVKTFTVTPASPAKATVYTFSETMDVSGDFVIEITNLSPSASTSNKDRVAIWNMNWTNKS